MHASIVLLTFLLFAVWATPICYDCDSSSDENCLQVDSSTDLEDCYNNGQLFAYECFSYNIQPDEDSTGRLYRGCVILPEGFETCDYLKNRLANVTWCESCSENKCNDGTP